VRACCASYRATTPDVAGVPQHRTHPLVLSRLHDRQRQVRKVVRPVVCTRTPPTFFCRRFWDLGQRSCTGTHGTHVARTWTRQRERAHPRQAGHHTPSLPSNMALRRSNSGQPFTSYGCGLHCGGAMLSHEKESACARRVSTAGRTGYTGARPHACIGTHTEHPSSVGSGARIHRDLRVLLLDAERHPGSLRIRRRTQSGSQVLHGTKNLNNFRCPFW